MHCADKTVAIHTLALARLIMQRKLPVYLHMLIPAVENAISGSAFRPRDIYRSRNGLTVEIDLPAFQTGLLEQLEAAVEMAPVPRRGRPPTNKTGRLD